MGALDVAYGDERESVKIEAGHYGDKNTVEAWLRQLQDLVSLVMTESSSVKAFFGRWKVIQTRLAQLPPLLTAMAQLKCLTDNTVCKELLQVLISTPQGPVDGHV